jgi:hypothetical protein
MPKLFKYSKVIYTSWKTKKLIKLFIIIYDHLTHDIIDSNFVVEQILTQKKLYCQWFLKCLGDYKNI